MGGSGGLGGAAWGKGVGVADIPLAGDMGPWGGDGLAAGGGIASCTARGPLRTP